jgi:predicted PhzF superfamily epimerase YddE/YHI9
MPALVHVDAFADGPFSGNPAAVCLLDSQPDTTWMQAMAAELNLPATVFVWQHSGGFGLRWFTAQTELTLCGHGTLAAAHVLFGVGAVPKDAIRFQTSTDTLVARKLGELIELDFPAEASHAAVAPVALTRALGAEPVRVERNRLDFLVELESEETVLSLRPDLSMLAEVETRGVIVTARGHDGADFVSRFFAPRFGLDEDYVTGSAHCCLGPYWQHRLGRSMLVGRQLSRRGGVVRVRIDADRVRLSGRAVTVARGELSAETLALAA